MIPCSGCGDPIDILERDLLTFRKAGYEGEADYYHEVCYVKMLKEEGVIS